jgi:hypothetical protein
MSTQEVDSVISLQQEKIAKKELAKKIIKAKCSEEHLEFEDLKVFGAALKDGDELVIQLLSGGETNFSYKVHLQKDPTKALFCKLSFTRAL